MKKNMLYGIIAILLTSTIGYAMIPGRPRNTTYVRPYRVPTNRSINRLIKTPLNQRQIDNLILPYYKEVDQASLQETMDILKDMRQKAIDRFEQNKTFENSNELSTIYFAIECLERPGISFHTLNQLSDEEPGMALTKEILNPIVQKHMQEFSYKHALTKADLLAIQKTLLEGYSAVEYLNKYQTRIPKEKSPQKEQSSLYNFISKLMQFIENPQKFIMGQAYLLTKDVPQKIAQPSQEAEEMYAQSLEETSGIMPRTYNFTWPQIKPLQNKQQIPTFRRSYNPAAKSAIEALEQNEHFGIGYQ